MPQGGTIQMPGLLFYVHASTGSQHRYRRIVGIIPFVHVKPPEGRPDFFNPLPVDNRLNWSGESEGMHSSLVSFIGEQGPERNPAPALAVNRPGFLIIGVQKIQDSVPFLFKTR